MKKWSRDPPPGHRGACYQRSPTTPDVAAKKISMDLAFSARELGTHKISERGAYWFKRNTPLFPFPASLIA
jgi:hypothetical protein